MTTIRISFVACYVFVTTVAGTTLSGSATTASATPAAAAVHALSRTPVLPQASAVRAVARPGAFCKTTDAGKIARSSKGDALRCETTSTDPRYRWRTIVK